MSLLVILITAAVFSFLWSWVRDYFSEKIIPWVRDKYGVFWADQLGDLVLFLDNVTGYIRQKVRGAYRFIKERILGIKKTYFKQSAHSAVSITETILKTNDGKFLKRTEEEHLSWDELPEQIRSEMIRQQQKVALVDVRAAFLSEVEIKAEKCGLNLMEMTV